MGPRERDLFRRAGNPLFPADRRTVLQEQVAAAQRADAAECAALHSSVTSLIGRVVEGPDFVEMDSAKTLLDEGDALLVSCLSHGAQPSVALAETLAQTGDQLLAAVRQSLKHENASSAFDHWVEARAASLRLQCDSAVLEIARLDAADVVPAICSMQPEAIAGVLESLHGEARDQARSACITTLMSTALLNEVGADFVDVRLRALGISDE